MDSGLLMILILVLPAIGGLIGYALQKRSAWIATASISIAFVLSVFALLSESSWQYRFLWLPGFELGWRVDNVSLALIGLVLFISLLVHVFSMKYMEASGHPRYYAKLGFFTFAMLGLLMSDHLILLFIFWELVGFASYLLIGFHHQQDDSAKSAKWAFLTNRVADVALLAAILALGLDQSFFLSELTAISSVWIGGGLLIGAMGKSAQLPFSAWLPRAMTGPTPVSALIHAATMVAAGVYLLIRVGPFLPEVILTITVIVGAATAFFGAFTAMTLHDIKQVLAYSTISQLGFMFLGIGAGAIESSFFHLWTHAFFKAGLFLAAGVIIHHIGTQDMRKMGGLSSSMKWLMTLHLLCGLALAGIPFFSGFMSKEGIMQAVWFWAESQTAAGHSESHIVTYFAFFTLFLTAWYIGRQIWLIYWTPSRVDEPIELLKFDWGMGGPVLILTIGALFITQGLNPFSSEGWVLAFVGFESVAPTAHLVPYVTSGLAVFGLVHCYGLYGPRRFYVQHYSELTYPPSIVGRLSFFGWYLDDAYDRLIAPGYVAFSIAMHWIDNKIIDGFVNGVGVLGVVFSKIIGRFDLWVIDGFVNIITRIARTFGTVFSRIQSGQVQHQIGWLLAAVILVLLFILF